MVLSATTSPSHYRAAKILIYTSALPAIWKRLSKNTRVISRKGEIVVMFTNRSFFSQKYINAYHHHHHHFSFPPYSYRVGTFIIISLHPFLHYLLHFFLFSVPYIYNSIYLWPFFSPVLNTLSFLLFLYVIFSSTVLPALHFSDILIPSWAGEVSYVNPAKELKHFYSSQFYFFVCIMPICCSFHSWFNKYSV